MTSCIRCERRREKVGRWLTTAATVGMLALLTIAAVCGAARVPAAVRGPVVREVATVGPAPRVLGDRLVARIIASPDAIVGDPVWLNAQVTGPVQSADWQIEPEPSGFLIQPGGLSAVLTDREPGVYEIKLAVASPTGDVAQDAVRVELLAAPPDAPVTVEQLTAPPEPVDVFSLVRAWIAEVNSPAKEAELLVLVGTFRTEGGLLLSGQAIDGADPLADLEAAAEQDLGPEGLARWAGFFARVRDFVTPLNESGQVTTADQFGRLLNSLAALMEAANQ